ncbi:hypothetical protein FOS14_18500 [Skermania sp. ID1734]|uniref:hypothetical protein n=1 Tax=Skermania sp. ID1734 TaxID=2597516 RepID=UPI00117FB672|nr:hypothetical protein [Skermania sp. ID1734]TSD95349.1 hypothetical protein FOS14_18500 [Skermania sp. ID1734]
MTIAVLILLGVAAVAPMVLSLRLFPAWLAPASGIAAIAAAAIVGTQVPKVHGFALGALLLLVVAAAALGGIPMAPSAFRIARWQPDAGEVGTAAGPLHGGRIIGILERAAVAATVLAGWPEGMAIVLAVKGLARYPELRAPHASEQFIIGTFTSVLWALCAAGIGRGLLT